MSSPASGDSEGESRYRNRTRARRDRFYKNRSGVEDDPSVVYRYFPVFENLILFILNSRRWSRNFRLYIQKEARLRSRLLIQGIVFLVCAAAFLVGTVVMVTLGCYLLLRGLTGSREMAAFLMALLGLVLGIILLYLMRGSFRRMTDFRSEEEVEEEGDDFSA